MKEDPSPLSFKQSVVLQNEWLLDYGERGEINRILRAIGKGDNERETKKRLLEFIGLIKYTENSVLVDLLDASHLEIGVIVEPHLSQFGNPDLMIIVRDKRAIGRDFNSDPMPPLAVYFVEAKMSSMKEALQDSTASGIKNQLLNKAKLVAALAGGSFSWFIWRGVTYPPDDALEGTEKRLVSEEVVAGVLDHFDLTGLPRYSHEIFHFIALTEDDDMPKELSDIQEAVKGVWLNIDAVPKVGHLAWGDLRKKFNVGVDKRREALINACLLIKKIKSWKGLPVDLKQTLRIDNDHNVVLGESEKKGSGTVVRLKLSRSNGRRNVQYEVFIEGEPSQSARNGKTVIRVLRRVFPTFFG